MKFSHRTLLLAALTALPMTAFAQGMGATVTPQTAPPATSNATDAMSNTAKEEAMKKVDEMKSDKMKTGEKAMEKGQEAKDKMQK